MHLTGHPFVDIGLAIATNIAKKKSIEDITANDLCNAVKELKNRIIQQHETEPKNRIKGELNILKTLASYWQNNPLMGKNITSLPKYEKVIEDLSQDYNDDKFGYCQICGLHTQVSEINRSWFPLSGSPDSDPTTLPELGGKQICINCFRAIVILPLGCLFTKTGPYFYHIFDPILQVEAVTEARKIINTSFISINTKTKKTIGNQQLRICKTKLTGRLELLEIVSGHLLWDHNQPCSLSSLPRSGVTMITFNNGNPAKLLQIHLPTQTLEFFSYINERGPTVYKAFLNWVKMCTGDIFEKICDNIEQRCSLAPLVRIIIKNKKSVPIITKEERIVIQDYETIALQKKERFDTLERLSKRVNEMAEKYRNSFIKQLGNITTMKRFLELLREFSKPEKTGFEITSNELRIIATDTKQSEMISLLYLLCISEQKKED